VAAGGAAWPADNWLQVDGGAFPPLAALPAAAPAAE
jgi:hypothetical protein